MDYIGLGAELTSEFLKGAIMRMKTLLGGIGVAAALLVLSGPPALAHQSESCRERIVRAKEHTKDMARQFGRHSDQERAARSRLEEIRDWCRTYDEWDARRDHDDEAH